MVEAITNFFTAIPFTRATWFTIFTLFFFVWLFAKASRDPMSPIKWEHLIVDSNNDRASPYKVGYLIGMIVGTWIVLRWADSGALTYDILGMYLTYLLGGAGVNSFSKSKSVSYQPQPYGNDQYADPYQQPYAPTQQAAKRRVQPAQPPVFDGTSDDPDQIPKP